MTKKATNNKEIIIGEGRKFDRIRRITGYLVGTTDSMMLREPKRETE